MACKSKSLIQFERIVKSMNTKLKSSSKYFRINWNHRPHVLKSCYVSKTTSEFQKEPTPRARTNPHPQTRGIRRRGWWLWREKKEERGAGTPGPGEYLKLSRGVLGRRGAPRGRWLESRGRKGRTAAFWSERWRAPLGRKSRPEREATPKPVAGIWWEGGPPRCRKR